MNPSAAVDLGSFIRDIPDFPKPGITFKDICPLLGHAGAFAHAIDRLEAHYRTLPIDCVVGIESRGFILGAPLALRLGVGFVPIRKPGKLPYQTERIDYTLEYGSGSLEIHADAIAPGQRVLLVDDLLATGGTIHGSRALVERLGGVVQGAGFLVELEALGGRSRLEGLEIFALLSY